MSEYTPPTYVTGEVCVHGGLARKCEICELRHELEWTKRRLSEAMAYINEVRSVVNRDVPGGK